MIKLNSTSLPQIFIEIVGILAIVAIVNFWLLIPTVLMLILFYVLRSFYMNAGRSVKRVEAQSKIP